SRELAAGHRVALAACYPALWFVGIALLHVRGLTPRVGRFFNEELRGLSGPFLPAVVVVEATLAAVGLAIVLVPLARRLRPVVDGPSSARFLRSVGLQLDAGRPLHAALAEGADAAGVARLARAARGAGARVAAGEPAADAWRSLPLPRPARERLAVATPAGLVGLLPDVADACDARAARRVERFVAWAVPAATVVAGLLVVLDYAVLTAMLNEARDLARPW
ncbi:MAG: type II secretion system F family protein, partial [Planctomycetia bacterium]|nr:type II secretion system F family protein [Planctomycetia bacterium]